MRMDKLWFENERIFVLTDDGRTLCQSLLYYPRLKVATDVQRNNYEVDSEGIHWDDLDEDVSFESFEYDNPEPQGVSRLFLSFPELNATAIARRLGIDANVMRQFVTGISIPTPEVEQQILNEVRKVGKELVEI